MKLIAGTSHQQLAKQIADNLGIKLVDIDISRFPNEETRIWIKEPVQKEQVFILQTLSKPVNDSLVELALIVDAAKHAKADSITAVIPWMGYSPQDDTSRPGEPISSAVVASLLEAVGVDKLIAFDLHSPLNRKHFSIPIQELSAMELFIDHFKAIFADGNYSRESKEAQMSIKKQDCLSVALDKGARVRAKRFSEALDIPLIQFDKERDRHTGEVTFRELSGKADIKDKTIISFDDFVSTGGTRIQAAQILKSKGARTYIDCVTHLFPIPETYQKLKDSSIDQLFVTDTIPTLAKHTFDNLNVLSVAPLISKAIAPETSRLPKSFSQTDKLSDKLSTSL